MTHRILTRALPGLLIGSVALALSGCSAAGTAAPSTAAAPSAQAPAGESGAGDRGASRVPGTFGLIADISGTTAQVQGDDGQTAVTWTDATTFTQQVAGTAADIAVGSCVSVSSDADGASSDAVTATSVTVSDPVDGACTGGSSFGGGGGGFSSGGAPDGNGDASARPEGRASAMPEGAGPSGAMPTDLPEGAASAQPGGGRGGSVTGTVAAVSGDTLTVTVTGMQAPGEDATASPSTTETTVTVTLTDDTGILVTQDATASALEVGRCAWATGETDTTGAVAATSIRVSDATDGDCGMA